MSDLDRDGNLDFLEFCVAMHIIVGVSKYGLPLPASLPPALLPPEKAHLVVTQAIVPGPVPQPAAASQRASSARADVTSDDSNRT